MTCKCFTCTHKDPRLKKAYCVGYMEACEWFLNWAKEQGIKMGSISDNDLGGIYAQINCNYEETGCYARDLPDIDEVPRNEEPKDKIKIGTLYIDKRVTFGDGDDDDVGFALEDYEVPRKTTGNKIEQKMLAELERKLNAIVDAAIDAVNELKGGEE